MNIPLEPPADQSDPLQEPDGAAADAAQRDLFEFFSEPPSEASGKYPAWRFLEMRDEMQHEPTRNDVPLKESAPRDEAAANDPGVRTTVAALDEGSKANLRRLEETVRWLQSEAGRMPPAALLSPVPRLPDMEPIIDRTTPDRTLRRPPTLPIWLQEHETRPQSPPPREPGVFWPRAVTFLLACGIAAPLSYFFAVLTSPPPKHVTEATELASLETTAASPPLTQRLPEARNGLRFGAAEPELASAETRALTPEQIVQTPKLPPSESPIRPSPETAAAATKALIAPPPVTTGVAVDMARSSQKLAERASAPAAKMVDSQEVKLLIDRGKQFFDVGDLVAARILFLRAANAGDAAAALEMGATYDPVILAGRGVRGVAADLEKARGWYEKAKEMGSPEGPRRLEMLANR